MLKLCFEASRSLDVYEIIEEVLHTSSNPRNRSQAVVKILFKRRVEYHIGHTFLEVVIKCIYNFFAGDFLFYFLQTFLMVIIGYSSFYFEIERISDRAIVVLTTILTFSTVSSSIQDVSILNICNNHKSVMSHI